MATPWVAFIFSNTQLQALLNETPNRRSSKQLPCSIAKLARQLVRQGRQPAPPYYADYNRGKVVQLQDTHPGAIALAKARQFSHKQGAPRPVIPTGHRRPKNSVGNDRVQWRMKWHRALRPRIFPRLFIPRRSEHGL